MSGVVEALSFTPDSSLGRNVFARGSDAAQGLANRGADFGHLEGGRDMMSRLSHCALPYSGSSRGQGCKKERLDGCLFPITLPVTAGLGENAAGTLNALVPVPASGGGRRPCSLGLLIRTSQFRIRRPPSSQPWSIHTTFFPCSRLWSASCFGSRACKRGRRVGGLDLCTGPPVMSMGRGTPSGHPRQ